jgi:hypothetical protein
MFKKVAFHWLKRLFIIELLNIEGKALRGVKETSSRVCTCDVAADCPIA